MVTNKILKELKYTDPRNIDSYQDLIVSIEESFGILSILIAICDSNSLRDKIIDAYEAELEPDIIPYRVKPSKDDLSIRLAIRRLSLEKVYFQKETKAVFTVTGIDEISKSEEVKELGTDEDQNSLMRSLQWAREGFRELHYPIVFWLNTETLNLLIQKAPDFWSWRKGVFRFFPEMAISEIRRNYDGNWVGVEVTKRKDGISISGVVRAADEDPDRLIEKVEGFNIKDLYIFYCGSV